MNGSSTLLDMRSEFGKRLFEARKLAGLTQQKAADGIMGQSTLAELERTGQGSAHTAELAKRYNVNPHWLATGKGEMTAFVAREQSPEFGPNIGGKVPLISDVQAGAFKDHVDNFHPGDGGMEQIPTTVPVKRYTFALRVAGDSMEPEFREGMILVIEPELEAMPGDFVVAKNGEGTTFKQLVKDGQDWYLKPMNPRYPIKPLGESQIIGVLRAVEKRYR